MSESNKEQAVLQDIVAREASNITLEEIEQIARDDSERHAAEKKYGEILYSSIILTLTHKNYSEREAEKLWLEIRHHLYVMSTKFGRYVGVAVAAMDYLSNIVNELNSPVAISENKSTFIVATAVKDHLTGLFVRDVFQAILVKEIEKVKRTGIDLCLLMIDLDDFKKVNDNHGHIAGDEVLRQIGKTLLSHIREMDVAARYGGEELAIIMPETSIETAANVAERLRSKIELLQFDWRSVTVSIGVSHADRDVNSAEKLIKAADEALYAAKEAGKNRVVYTQS